MIRFIDLTKDYWTYPDDGVPICAFLRTNDDRFIETINGEHTFGSQEEVNEHPESHRLRGLMPDNFFTQPKRELSFIDVTKKLSEGQRACAFPHFGEGGIILTKKGCNVFRSQEEVDEHPESCRLRGLMPNNFFEEQVA
jgi:hypothetical protein